LPGDEEGFADRDDYGRRRVMIQETETPQELLVQKLQ
jgi:lactam utilization protein B